MAEWILLCDIFNTHIRVYWVNVSKKSVHLFDDKNNLLQCNIPKPSLSHIMAAILLQKGMNNTLFT